MKKLFLVLICMVSIVICAPISFEKAELIAKNIGRSEKIKLKQKFTHKKQGMLRGEQTETPLLYVFQNEESNGFMLIAGDDVFKPIIGYSENGIYDSLDMPPNFAYYLENIQREMAFALENGQEQTTQTANEWRAYSARTARNAYVPGTKLMQTKWNQRSPYNLHVPLPGAPTGCVATAMAQIMNYHQHPKATLTKTIPGYTTRTLKLQIPAIDSNTVTFDWESMNTSEAVATLMNVVGRSVEMDYNYFESSAGGTYTAESALLSYFDYNPSISVVNRYSYNSDDWVSIMKKQIDLGLPVSYGGKPEVSNGHQWVLDGYDSNNNFHMNWGWGGSFDGFFAVAISKLNPTPTQNYNYHQSAIINIKPAEHILTGMGTLSKPYIINTVEELTFMAKEIGKRRTAYSTAHYKLGNNITFSDEWTVSIGNLDYPFSGVFDGNGKVISGLTTGLFGEISDGTVKNLGVENVNVNSSGGVIAGGINNSKISNCYVTGTINSSYVGGIAGNVLNSVISDCYTAGTISGSGTTGGIAINVYDGSIIENCYSTAIVNDRGNSYHPGTAGGIAGNIHNSVISNCYTTGTVNSIDNIAGGIAGSIRNSIISNCYTTGTVNGITYAGSIAGVIDSNSVIKNCAALNQSITGEYTYRIFGFDYAGNISNNIAFSDMLDASGNTFSADARKNGENISVTEILADGTLGGRFTAPVWTTENGKLPGFGQARFAPFHIGGKYTLTTQGSSPCGATITVDGEAVSYGTTAHYPGTQVTISISPTDGCVFTGWSNASASGETTVTIIMDNDKTLIANFQKQTTSVNKVKKSDNRYGIKFAKNIVNDKAEISIILPNDEKIAEAKIVIYDMTGNVVFVGANLRVCPFVWNLTNTAGRNVANGTYLIIAETRGLNGQRYRYSAKLGVKR